MMAVPLALSSQYQRVLVVVCLPELRAWEISPVCAPASGSSQLMRVLLPVPEGPSTSVFLPCSVCQSWCKSLCVCCSVGGMVPSALALALAISAAGGADWSDTASVG